MTRCLFVSDLHGRLARYEKLFAAIDRERPDAVFLGGDLLPAFGFAQTEGETPIVDFVRDYLLPELAPRAAGRRIFLILGNDDPRAEEPAFVEGQDAGAWEYVHDRAVDFGPLRVVGYQYVPPTPFRLKDWERYDVSRYVDPGCVSPESGGRSVPIEPGVARRTTIREDLEHLTAGEDLDRSILLLHTPPYRTNLDRAALDGKMIDHAPLDVHVGSIAVRRLIEARQPLLALSGHIHESAKITGSWRDRIGRTHCFTGAHHGPELALVRFDPERLDEAERVLL